MISILKRNNWLIVKTIILITIIIPIGIIAYELFVKGKDSVVFLANYPTAVGLTVIIYYALLLVAGVVWIIKQLQFLLILKNEKTKNEMLHLQSQVNPHFFFNMLNNLYGMIDKDTEKSKDLILKLSDLMRYSIYEGEKQLVFLEKEIVYLKNYIELHQMRYHKRIDIQFNCNVDDKTVKVIPLLFIILLENAFKHGVENLREHAFVHINLSSKNNEIIFEIRNNFDEETLPEKSGIGIKNLKRRLELAYPKNHNLIFTRTDSIYNVQLQLKQ